MSKRIQTLECKKCDRVLNNREVDICDGLCGTCYHKTKPITKEVISGIRRPNSTTTIVIRKN